jgi:hypothetical protein
MMTPFIFVTLSAVYLTSGRPYYREREKKKSAIDYPLRSIDEWKSKDRIDTP